MTLGHFIAIFVAGLAAGTINTVVGSGSLITFPTLVTLGYAPLVANVSNNIGLVPGSVSGMYGYRRELRGQARRLLRLAPMSALGGATGSLLLLALPSSVFKKVVVVLIAIALVLVVSQPKLARRLAARREANVASSDSVPPVLAFLVCAAGVYGGYFGAAQGIILIAMLGIFLDDELQRLNACKNVLAGTVNGVASIAFLVNWHHIDWAVVGTIAVGSTLGGQIGAKVGRRFNTKVLRGVIVVVGLAALVRILVK